MQHELMPFRDFEKDEVFACITGLIKSVGQLEDEGKQEAASWYCDCVAKMAANAEISGLCGNIWQSWMSRLFVEYETPFSLAQERSSPLSGTLKKLVAEDLEILYSYLHYDLNQIDDELGISAFGRFGEYQPFSFGSTGLYRTSSIVQKFTDAIKKAPCAGHLYDELTKFYLEYGVGQFALNKAFRWDGRTREIVSVTHTEDISLSGLVGYIEQKKTLVDNTLAFLEGRPANNVLLYGESGTGKSSSVKALLNEFAPRGLRMIEVYKHQIEDLDTIVDIIKVRNYKFILFMDDLSFEEFEVEYKFLKAFIEGGLEKRPDNILIYATSNRRHLMKETWADREDKTDDMHESETMQERMSLVDRFGLMVRYFSPQQEEYLEIVRTLAKEYNVNMSDKELQRGAIKWELKHGGFSGRAARQFVEFIAGQHKVNN